MERQLRELYVEITNHCFQKCIHCSSCAIERGYPEISYDKLTDLIDQAIPLGLERFVISGGEPFLHPNFTKLLNYLWEQDIRMTVYSCGVIRDKDGSFISIPEEYFKQIKKYNGNIIFSLHAGTIETQYKITGIHESFTLACDSIRKAVSMGIPAEVHCVPMEVNFEELDTVLEKVSQLGVHKVSFLRYVPQGRGIITYLLSREHLHILRDKIVEWKVKFPEISIRMGTPFNCLTLSGSNCTAGYDKLMISAAGEVFPCEAFKYMRGRRPTIYQKDIRDIWLRDPLLNRIRTIQLQNISVCKDCQYKDQCKAGCAGQRLHLNGDFEKGPDPLCSLINY